MHHEYFMAISGGGEVRHAAAQALAQFSQDTDKFRFGGLNNLRCVGYDILVWL